MRYAEDGRFLLHCFTGCSKERVRIWAVLSTSGLRALDLPKDVGNVVVLADGDAPGEAAASDCALRWIKQGGRVRIARLPQGMDFDDMLRAPLVDEGEQ
jgi:hypothetical protein